MTFQQEIRFDSTDHGYMRDLTPDVRRIIQESRVKNGLVNVFVMGSTGAVGAIEYEEGLMEDLPKALDRMFPAGADYGHERTWQDGNGHSHLQATLLGPSLTVPIANGIPLLGTWQQVFFIECDIKPRTRRLVVTVTGD